MFALVLMTRVSARGPCVDDAHAQISCVRSCWKEGCGGGRGARAPLSFEWGIGFFLVFFLLRSLAFPSHVASASVGKGERIWGILVQPGG